MKTIQEFLEEQIREDLILAVLSGSRKKDILQECGSALWN